MTFVWSEISPFPSRTKYSSHLLNIHVLFFMYPTQLLD